ncbi:response regulator transcription factor [Bradyrhizobium sp. CB1015]|uniref:response regulator transcription factor n=1 Tax=Bradyrhizobium sp. CB1015 TaxID=2976822 RepID=UPI0021A9FBA6|nr:response regulator [Bradyrhizobium sp. CB1015]UWU89064.1 response regulator [Bradyrhizobium sp. CB1015]
MIRPNPISVEVFLVDDEKDVTDALAWLLDSVKIRSRAFASASAFLEALGQFDGAACAVVDLRMPEMSGLELQNRIAESGHDLPLIFLTAHGDVPAAVNAMQAGATDFIQKPFNPDKFLASVQRAMRLAGERHTRRLADLKIHGLIKQLSAREHDVLHGLLDGRTSKEIAVALDISPKTVDVHRANVMKKMGVASSAELIRLVGLNAGPGLRGSATEK